MNNTLDAVIGPLNVSARYVKRNFVRLAEASEILQSIAENDYTRRLAGSSKQVKSRRHLQRRFQHHQEQSECLHRSTGSGRRSDQQDG